MAQLIRAPLLPRPAAGLDDEAHQRVVSSTSKRSDRSHSSSFEADDERSTSPSPSSRSASTMENGSSNNSNGAAATHRAAAAAADDEPSYPGEDTRPTSTKELAGWYMYGFASETYVICAIASFIPILLESLARENGVLLSDRTTPCGESEDRKAGDDGQCVVYVLGIEVNTASFAMYTFSISVLLQALIVVSISCAADHGNYRKKLLLSFAWLGSGSVMLYIFISKSVYLLGALLAIVSNTSFGASFVLLNSFLPLLVRHHPSVQYGGNGGGAHDAAVTTPDLGPADADSQRLEDSLHEGGGVDDDDDDDLEDRAALLSSSGGPANRRRLTRVQTHEELTSLELSLSTQISARGIGIGYSAALFVQCVAIFIVYRMHNTTWSQRVVLFLVGAWWAVFTIPAALWLRPRPGPPLQQQQQQQQSNNQTGVAGALRSWLAYTIYAWKSLFRTVRLARRLVDIVLFLGGWFLLSDAIATTSSTAILFAKTQLHMEVWALGLINVISTTTGVAGAFSWAYISQRFGLKPHHTILACIGLFEVIPLYGLLGYLPFVRAWGVLGLQRPWEMFPLAAVYGFVLGGLGGYCRSLFGELIPPGSEAAFYALYAITDKGSSVFGPAIVGAIIDASGEIRPAFWFLAALVGLPAPLFYFVDVERGKTEGEKLAEIIEGFKTRLQSETTESDAESRGILAAYDEDEDTEREAERRRRRSNRS